MYLTARDQNMVESGVTEGEKKHCQVLPVFFLLNEHNYNNPLNTKPQAKKQRFLKLSQKFPEEKQQLVEYNSYNIRKVLCKSFIISTESTVLVSSGYSFVAVEVIMKV